MGNSDTINELKLPRLGENMDEARVVSWLIRPGAEFRRGETLLEIETDKTVMEVPALCSGRLVAKLVAEGEIVPVDAVIAHIEQDVPTAAAGMAPEPTRPSDNIKPTAQKPRPVAPQRCRPGTVAASPAARRSARDLGVDLTRVAGTGRRGSITRPDVANSSGGLRIDGERGPFFVRSWQAGKNPEHHAVLVHGLFGDSLMFDGLARRLVREGVGVFGFDLPGHGRASDLSMDFHQCAECLAEQLNRMKQALPQRPVLVGHSLGAALAARAALETDFEVGGLCLLNPVGLGTRVSGRYIADVANAKSSGELRNALERMGGATLSDVRLADLQNRLNRGHAAISTFCSSIIDGDRQRVSIVEELSGSEFPMALFLGRSDRIIPWHADGTLANIPSNVGVHFLSGGHFSLLDEVGAVFDVLRRTILPSARGGHFVGSAGRSSDVHGSPPGSGRPRLRT